MRNRRPRNFRHRSNNRNFRHRAGDSDKPRMLSGSFTNGMGKIFKVLLAINKNKKFSLGF